MNSNAQTSLMFTEDTVDALKGIIVKVLKLPTVPGGGINETTNLYELGLESLNVVEMLTDIETQFDIVVDVEDLSAELFQTFGSLASFVEGKRHARN